MLGFLQFNESGFVDISVFPRYLMGVAVAGLLAAIFAFYFSVSMAKLSFSPVLHRTYVPCIITIGYSIIGLFATSIVFINHSLFLGQIGFPSSSGTIFGLSIGAILGFLTLIYIDQYEVNPHQIREELEAEIHSINYHRGRIERADKAPILLTP